MSNQAFNRSPNAGPLHDETTDTAECILSFMENVHAKYHGGKPIDHTDLFQGLALLYGNLTGVSPVAQLIARSDARKAAGETIEVPHGN